jgi:hypothetical protein
VPDFKISAIPNSLRVAWRCFAPLGICLSIRIAWEKTFLTWDRGAQMIGFSLVHIHSLFFILGALCSYLLILWLVPALIHVIVRRNRISVADIVMILTGFFIVVVMATPDTFFASAK